MTAAQVNLQFHALGAAVDIADHVVHLTGQLLAQGERLLIRAIDAGQARTLDEALWQLADFVPHCLADDLDQAAAWVVIAAPGQREPARDCVINLRADIVIAPQVQRIVELIPADDNGKQAARSRWRAYQTRGLKPELVAAD